ncbi:MAG: phytanoyl-CoA dioxygenase family protein [Gammaproteobacteria bacterium]|nr:phytanoyl-CoA dioxygenase family protein [Gammaproteobacteria bacterium]
MSNPYLTTNQVYEFLDLGYLKIQLQGSSYGRDFAARLFRRARESYRNSDLEEQQRDRIQHIADTSIESIPEVKHLLSSEELNGALTSLLGKSFYRYRHSFIHRADRFDQSFHKDSPLPWGTKGGIRSHKLEWAMVFYYPQDTMLELGPTEILPGTQYWNMDRLGTGNTHGEDRLSLDFDREKVGFSPDLELRDKHLATQWQTLDRFTPPKKIEVSAGSIVLVHFDLFHRATRMSNDGERYMYKFWFTRTAEPEVAAKSTSVRYQVRDPRRKPIVDAIGSWMGMEKTAAPFGRETDHSADYSARVSEADRVCNAYLKAKSGDHRLLRDACSGIESIRRASVYALATQPNLAHKAIAQLLGSPDIHDRQCAAFLAGECCCINGPMVKNVIELVYDEESVVSRAAVVALGKIKRRQQNAISNEVHDKIVDSLLVAMTKGAALRQLAYLSLLCFASSSDNPLRSEQIARIARVLKTESNLYALRTGNEVLERARLSDSKHVVSRCTEQLESETSSRTFR